MSHNPIRPWRDIARRRSRQIMVGRVPVGGGAPISVQTMTNTDSGDARATLAQIIAAADAGADIVRVSAPDEAATAALHTICRESPVPIVADIHFHYKRAIEAAEAGAACLRINPGNIGDASRVREVVKAARDHGCSIRIGVNAGSLERHLLEKYGEPCPDAMVESGLDHIKLLQDNDFHEFKISVKASDVFLAAAAYQQLAAATDAPIHLGITEAGGLIGNFTGEADFLDQRECLAASPRIYGQLVPLLSKYSQFAGAGDKAAVRQAAAADALAEAKAADAMDAPAAPQIAKDTLKMTPQADTAKGDDAPF